MAEPPRLREVPVGLFGSLVLVAGLVIGPGALQVEDVASDVGHVENPFLAEDDRPAEAPNDSMTFLVVGVDPADRVTGGRRAEAALLRLTDGRRHAQVVSISLDTWVAEQTTTIETALSNNGPVGAVTAIEAPNDIRIEHHVENDYGVLASLVDTIGGSPVDVPESYGSQGV